MLDRVVLGNRLGNIRQVGTATLLQMLLHAFGFSTFSPVNDINLNKDFRLTLSSLRMIDLIFVITHPVHLGRPYRMYE